MSYHRPPTNRTTLADLIAAMTMVPGQGYVTVDLDSRERKEIVRAVVDVYRRPIAEMEMLGEFGRTWFCPVQIDVVAGFLSVDTRDELLQRVVVASLLDVLGCVESDVVHEVPAALAFIGDQAPVLRASTSWRRRSTS